LSGLIAALNLNILFLLATLIGVITGVEGGFLRDMVVKKFQLFLCQVVFM